MVLKRLLPKSLFVRALLILVVPTLLIQLIMAYIFFDRHWVNVTRYMSGALAGETAFLVNQLKMASANEKPQMIKDFESATGLEVSLEPLSRYDPKNASNEFADYQLLLRQKIDEAFTVRRTSPQENIETCIKLPGVALVVQTSVKRVESPTTNLFLMWMMGSSIVFLFIAIGFLRNQIRPISRLAKAAENFGRGVDTPDFRPQGAKEVRIAARAFIVMRERIQRQIRTRTDMLSGISHDLRTPLTRMKLQLAMLGDNDAAKEMGDDVQQMEYMIAEYLDFARGEGGEESVRMYLNKMLSEVAADYQRVQADVTFMPGEDVELELKITAFRRMLHNLIDNAIRYGKRCHVTSFHDGVHVCIIIDDEGSGIPTAHYDQVFRPFSRLDASRNSKTGGVGLGLTIARDIVLAHGGTIELAQSPKGGLRVLITLPLGRTE